MRKILTLTIIAIVALFGLSVGVNAADVSTEADLKSAVLAEQTVTLTSDIELTSSLEIGTNITINLNGYNITAADGMLDDSLVIVLHGGRLTVEGDGSISATNSNASARIAVKMTKGGNAIDFINSFPATLLVNSGTLLKGSSFGISGNGNPDRVNTIIAIQGGTVEGGSTGIYHPQEGTLEIYGGTVKGSTGIEMRSGTLKVLGGNIIGTGAPTDVTPNGNGTTTDGAGIAIAQHTTEKNISVVIEGGNVQGYSALYESNPQSNATMDKVSIQINGGEFEAINGGIVSVYSEDKKDFITGGTFSTDVSSYVDSTLEAVEDEDGNVYVGKLHTITVMDTEYGKVTPDKTEAVKGQTIKLEVEPKDGYKLKGLGVVDGPESFSIDVTDSKTFEMPDVNVTVIAIFEEIPSEPENPGSDDQIIPDEPDSDEPTTPVKPGNPDSEEPIVPGEPEISDPEEPIKPGNDGAIGEAEVEPSDDEETDKETNISEDSKKEGKDDTPKTGSVDIVVYISAIIAVIALAGIVIVKKYTK